MYNYSKNYSTILLLGSCTGEHGGTFHVRGAEGVKSWYEVSILYIQCVYKALYWIYKGVYIYICIHVQTCTYACMYECIKWRLTCFQEQGCQSMAKHGQVANASNAGESAEAATMIGSLEDIGDSHKHPKP